MSLSERLTRQKNITSNQYLFGQWSCDVLNSEPRWSVFSTRCRKGDNALRFWHSMRRAAPRGLRFGGNITFGKNAVPRFKCHPFDFKLSRKRPFFGRNPDMYPLATDDPPPKVFRASMVNSVRLVRLSSSSCAKLVFRARVPSGASRGVHSVLFVGGGEN